MENYSESGTVGDEADYLGIGKAINLKCPSFNALEVHRTPHAGILYFTFTANEEDLKLICNFCYWGHVMVSVFNEDDKFKYRFGTNNDRWLLEQIQRI